MTKSFFYFAYGSNLLSKRIHINNPSAVRAGIGRLENFRLDFATFSSRWKGASATIVPSPGYHIWGAVWEIGAVHLESLDRQEGVAENIYFPMDVRVLLADGTCKICRVYQQCANPDCTSKLKDLPFDRRPSAVYLRTILLGAEESQLPFEYQQFLKKIPHNGYDGEIDIQLNLSDTSEGLDK